MSYLRNLVTYMTCTLALTANECFFMLSWTFHFFETWGFIVLATKMIHYCNCYLNISYYFLLSKFQSTEESNLVTIYTPLRSWHEVQFITCLNDTLSMSKHSYAYINLWICLKGGIKTIGSALPINTRFPFHSILVFLPPLFFIFDLWLLTQPWYFFPTTNIHSTKKHTIFNKIIEKKNK